MKTWRIVIAAALLASPSYARILTTKPQPSETFSAVLSLTVGGGVEFESDDEKTQWEFPVFAEYNLTKTTRLTIEPKLVHLDPKDEEERTVSGWGDLETSAQWEFLRERRYRPACSVEGIIRWPTATHDELGDRGRDYTIGLIASKDFVYVEADIGLHYTFVGAEDGHDLFELTVAAEIPVNHRLSVLTESVTDFETGRRGGNSIDGTVGLAWRVNEHLKLEAGGTLDSDGTWKVIFAWEWSFAGED
jgi:hypothetical protein